jgi:hypothetical protein
VFCVFDNIQIIGYTDACTRISEWEYNNFFYIKDSPDGSNSPSGGVRFIPVVYFTYNIHIWSRGRSTDSSSNTSPTPDICRATSTKPSDDRNTIGLT